MSFWIFTSIILLIAVVVLLYSQRNKTAEKEFWKKQDKRDWTLKIALEKTFHLPTVEAKEMAVIEAKIDRIMQASVPDDEKEEKVPIIHHRESVRPLAREHW